MQRSSKRWIWVALGVALLGAVALALVRCQSRATTAAHPIASAPPRKSGAFEVAETIYEAGLRPGWTEGGWGSRELTAGMPARVSFASFGGLTLEHAALEADYGGLSFRIKAPANFGDFLRVSLLLVDKAAQPAATVDVALDDSVVLDDGWREVTVPFRALDRSGGSFTGIVLQARRTVSPDWVLLDRIVLTKPDSDSLAAGAPREAVAAAVDCKGPASSINPLVYGISAGLVSSGESAHRIGGNPMTRLNWDVGNLWNTGSDWYFENVRGDDSFANWIDTAQRANLQVAMTVPLIGWVAKDSTSVGFPTARFGPQRGRDPHRPEAGDGYTPGGEPIAPGPPSLTSEAAPPERIKRWVTEQRARDGKSGKRAIHMYLLDNEPDLWHKTHRDVHPEPLALDELLDRTLRYAAAVREADPDALIAGPCSWGWPGYFFSGKDQEPPNDRIRPDRLAHAGTALIPWYLARLAEHEKRTGTRLLDMLDVHYYPQGQNVYSAASDDETAALRIRSTRSLWDPTYLDESWIKDKVRLIPRLREWVAQNYPGRGVSLGEWSFGGEQHISGALATAEALGRFGQQQLTAAFYWRSPKPDTKTYQAFRIFRNYDAQGARFLDFSIPTSSAPQVSLFASRNADSTQLVLVLLNLDPVHAAQVSLSLSSCGELERRRSFSYAATTKGIVLDPPSAPGASATSTLLAPYSIKVIEYARKP